MELFEILCGIAVVILALYYFLTSSYDFWKSRGVRGPRPIPWLDNFKDVMLKKTYVGDYLAEMYNTYKDESMIGIYDRKTPVLVIQDLDLIKDVLIKDFSVFANRGMPTSEKVRIF